MRVVSIVLVSVWLSVIAAWSRGPVDPGPRRGPESGAPLVGLSAGQLQMFEDGLEEFQHVHQASEGLGPRMQMDNCTSCHIAGGIGGTTPAFNPEIEFASSHGATNLIPSFLALDGPAREARFVRNADGTPDGGVHGLFTITGRDDAPGCRLTQPDFAKALREDNVIFRIPTPVFGMGLVEATTDTTFLEALNDSSPMGRRRHDFGIHGHAAISAEANHGGSGTLSHFGWKAQNESTLKFAAEAYAVELGITNDLFPGEREQDAHCQFAATPNDTMHLDDAAPMSDTERLAMFMRFLAPPVTGPSTAVTVRGAQVFTEVGCATCHRPTLTTGHSPVAALDHVTYAPFSDFLLHDMGDGLADGITQGAASGREFRTAPLWGLGQRLFFLHDGRARDLVTAILEHRSHESEANAVIGQFLARSLADQHALLVFLRGL